MKPVISRLENYRTQRAANEQRRMAAPRLSHRGCGGSSHMCLAMIMVCERAEKLIRALTQKIKLTVAPSVHGVAITLTILDECCQCTYEQKARDVAAVFC